MGQLTLTNYHIKHDKITMSFFFQSQNIFYKLRQMQMR